VYRSIDGGTTWTNISAGLPNIPMNTLVYTNGSTTDAIYVGADIGVYYMDNVITWTPFFTDLPNSHVTDLKIFYPTHKIRAATYGRGLWESDLYIADCMPPTLVTASSNTPVNQGGTINLTSSSTGGTSYAWAGANAYTSALQNPTIVGATTAMAGTYTVTVTSSGTCTATATTMVVVNATCAIPTLVTASSNTPVNQGSTINLTSNSTGGTSYAWAGPNAYTSALQNPTIAGATAAMAGTYTVTVTSSGTCTATATTLVVVSSVVDCSVSITAVAGTCAPTINAYNVSGTITFANAPSSGTLSVAYMGAVFQVFNAPFTSPQNYTLTGLGSDGATHTISAIFSENPACTNSANYTAPATCIVNGCPCGIIPVLKQN
jgi:hypothetical protein